MEAALAEIVVLGHAMEWSFSCEIIRPPQSFADMDEIDRAFDKVWSNLHRLGQGTIA